MGSGEGQVKGGKEEVGVPLSFGREITNTLFPILYLSNKNF